MDNEEVNYQTIVETARQTGIVLHDGLHHHLWAVTPTGVLLCGTFDSHEDADQAAREHIQLRNLMIIGPVNSQHRAVADDDRISAAASS